MSYRSSVGLRPWLLLLILWLMACTQVSQAQFSTLHAFSVWSRINGTLFNTDGYFPQGPLIQAKDGNFYGTAIYGGANGNGTVFRITAGGKLTTLHTFSAGNANFNADGAGPTALIQAKDGNLYGTTGSGSVIGWGTIFRITTGGTLTTLYRFSVPWSGNAGGNADGAGPRGPLIQASDGNLYGVTLIGGANNSGTVFRITTGGTLTTLYSFSALGSNDRNRDGYSHSGLIQASDGNLYGTAASGGADGSGTVFRITTGGTFTTLYAFSATPGWPDERNTDGANPNGALMQAKDGNLYGTAANGGINGSGTVYRITTGGTLTTLYNFSATSEKTNGAGTNSDGASPTGVLFQAKDGILYGTTNGGGENANSTGSHDGSGTVFQITTAGSLTSLYQFSARSSAAPYANSDGSNPVAGLIQAKDGNLYGVTPDGGTGGSGTVFQYRLLPLIALTQATTLDAQSITVDYTIAQENVTPSLRFDFYRSDQTTTDSSSTSIGTQTLGPSDVDQAGKPALSVGSHTVTFLSGTGVTLPPIQRLQPRQANNTWSSSPIAIVRSRKTPHRSIPPTSRNGSSAWWSMEIRPRTPTRWPGQPPWQTI